MLVIIPFFACYIAWTIANPGKLPDVGCTISTQYELGDLKEPQPLLLKRDGKRATIWYPDNDNGILKIFAGDSIYLACPGKHNYLKDRKGNSWGNEVKAVCIKDKEFEMNGVRQHFSSLVCKSHAEHHAKYTSSLLCLGRAHSSIEIGFNVRGTFIRTIELCRDKKTYTTYYTKFKLTKMIESYQKSYPRPLKFLAGRFYPGIDIDYLYRFETQLDTLARILNSTKLAKERLTKSQFLSHGHMAAKTDFVYGAQQRSTFWYLNTAPQWQTFNGGNWNSLEVSVRLFAASRRLDLDVYTGVHGQMTMEDIYGEQQPVYLDAEGAVILAPKFYWKVIYDPLSKLGTAFVGLNDPFVKLITDDVYLCTDISEKIEWLDWRPRNIISGISYACSVADLQKAVPFVPLLDVIGILM